MDDDLDDFGDHDGIGDNVDYDDGDWCPDVPEELPELIFTEGCDAEAVDIAPCISLGHCSGLNVSSSSDLSRGGDVDAVRVMLLGVSESGRPSMGIDLGYACTQQSSPPSHAAQSNMPHRQHLAGDGEPPPPAERRVLARAVIPLGRVVAHVRRRGLGGVNGSKDAPQRRAPCVWR